MIEQKIRDILLANITNMTAGQAVSLSRAILTALQPEGKLAQCPIKPCNETNSSPGKSCEGCDVYSAMKVQLAHDKLTMVKLPSEDELRDTLEKVSKWTHAEFANIYYFSSGLHRLLKEGK